MLASAPHQPQSASTMTTTTNDAPSATASPDGTVEVELVLDSAQTLVRVHVPTGRAGRAEALLGGRNWAAKHYWTDDDGQTVYQFDEPLPAGRVRLRIPVTGP